MELDVYDALIRGADAANEKIPGLVKYLEICGYHATGSSEGDAVTDPEGEIGNYTIQILIRGGYCLTHRGTNGKIRFWPVHRAVGPVVNDLIEDLKKTGAVRPAPRTPRGSRR